MDFHVYVYFDEPPKGAALECILLGLAQIKHTLAEQGAQIMSVISDFAAKQTKYNTDSTAAIAAVTTAIAGVTTDITELKAKIAELQASPGAITAEDQALLDGLTTAGNELSVKLVAMSDALTALDALTPPTVPPVA